jgi:hypothetical protein
MIGEGEPLNKVTDAPSILAEAKETVETAAEAVKTTTRRVAEAIDAGRQPGAPLDRLANWAREAPLQALTVAFLLGMLVGRRR